MCPSIAGQTITGAAVASTVVVSGSSASPSAILAMVFAVAGATTTTSARSATATCSIESSDEGSKRSVSTGRWVMLRNASGVANLVALSVISTSTSAPAWTSLLARSTALWQAMLPVTPRATCLPSSGRGILRSLPFVVKADAGRRSRNAILQQ